MIYSSFSHTLPGHHFLLLKFQPYHLLKVLTSSFKLFIISSFFFLFFSKSSNWSDMCWTDSVISASYLCLLICIDFVSLPKLYISATFVSSFLKLTNISEISLVLLVFELSSLTFFLSSSGFYSPLRSLFFEDLSKHFEILFIISLYKYKNNELIQAEKQ